jgi:hypothetical protein
MVPRNPLFPAPGPVCDEAPMMAKPDTPLGAARFLVCRENSLAFSLFDKHGFLPRMGMVLIVLDYLTKFHATKYSALLRGFFRPCISRIIEISMTGKDSEALALYTPDGKKARHTL